MLWLILNSRKLNSGRRKAERGSVLTWVVVLTVVSIGMASLVIDVGFIQHERAKMQMACDAAALAGAKQLPFEVDSLLRARDLAENNGYSHGSDGISVTGLRNPDGNHSGWYQVTISKPIDFFFAPVLGYTDGTIVVDATAAYTSPLPLYIASSSGEYGTSGIMNLSCFGPYAYYSYGDAYSVQWLNNGDDNPHYMDGGYNFILEIGADYYAKNGTNEVRVQIFDPNCWNIGNANDAGPGKVDEIRTAPGGAHPQPTSKYTTTQYQLYAPDSTPSDFDDDTLIAQATWSPGMTTGDMQWVTPSGWGFNLSAYGTGKYRINVKTLDGSSENGFNLRAGSPAAVAGTWFPDNGTEITALGTLPINFNQTGTVDIDLGYIPPEAAGFNVYISNFDTDVGSESILFYDEYGNSWPGTLSANGTFSTDIIEIPAGYQGGKLFAEYRAGAQDTSSWQLYFDGYLDDAPGDLKLVD